MSFFVTGVFKSSGLRSVSNVYTYSMYKNVQKVSFLLTDVSLKTRFAILHYFQLFYIAELINENSVFRPV